VTDARVVDASAAAALLFGEPAADAIAQQLEAGHLVAPALLAFELANICATKIRRNPEQQSILAAALRKRLQLPIEVVDVNHDGVLELAAQTRLTAYDASYLWLARQIGGRLITLDRQLAKAEAALLN
jgi:predicted nucleic acid-binding protein